jgi:hypothetical protein
MPSDTPLPHKPFTVFRSAAEEAAMRVEQETWDNEGGHTSATAGRVMHNSSAKLPYTAILQRHFSEATEHHFATMREAEAFIRRNTPVPGASLSKLYDRPASDR